MTNFDNKKIPNSEEETDMELTLDNLDGVSGGARIYPNLGIMEAGEGSPGLQTTDTTRPGTETTPAGGGFSMQRYKTEYK